MDVAFEEPQLRILLHDGVVLQAPLHGVKCMSACACNLPADAAEWDLSGLLIDGKPVSQDTVKAWIGAVYKQLGDRQYADELNEASRTMEGLYQLLRFADAVGSRQGVLPTFLAHVDGLELLVPCPGNHVTLIAGAWDRVQTHRLPVHCECCSMTCMTDGLAGFACPEPPVMQSRSH
jgi:hypothetical protein